MREPVAAILRLANRSDRNANDVFWANKLAEAVRRWHRAEALYRSGPTNRALLRVIDRKRAVLRLLEPET
jgi:hypothetical protein